MCYTGKCPWEENGNICLKPPWDTCWLEVEEESETKKEVENED